VADRRLEALRADARRLRDQADALLVGLGDENVEEREVLHARLVADLEVLKGRIAELQAGEGPRLNGG
jgi:ElaB/YqjD/DUF883 family membrane-anchored ribosome-binding protein